MSDHLPYNRLENKIRAWAASQAAIRAILVVGSRARTDPPPDEWSDLDLILYLTDPTPYTTDDHWLTEMGRVVSAHLGTVSAGEAEWLVLYENDLKADYLLSPFQESLQQTVEQSPYRNVFRRGVRVLLDKDTPGQPLALPPAWFEPPSPPSPTVFQMQVNGFLIAATRAAKFLRRGDLWRAKTLCDGDLKQRLLTMLEWQAQAVHGPDQDIWYDGRYLDCWADPAALVDLSATFGAYNETDQWRALMATVGLYCRLAREAADRWHITYPAEAETEVTAWLRHLRRSASQ